MTDRPLNILAIPGSLRKESYNKSLLRAAAEVAPPTVEVTVFENLDLVPVFNEDLEQSHRLPEGVTLLHQAVAASDGVIIATPEYNQSVPGAVKNMIDWLSRSEPGDGLGGRPTAVLGATTGPWGTRIAQTSLRQMLASAGAPVMPQPTMFVARAASLFDADGYLVDPETRDRLARLVGSFGEWVARIRAPLLVDGIADLAR